MLNSFLDPETGPQGPGNGSPTVVVVVLLGVVVIRFSKYYRAASLTDCYETFHTLSTIIFCIELP